MVKAQLEQVNVCMKNLNGKGNPEDWCYLYEVYHIEVTVRSETGNRTGGKRSDRCVNLGGGG